VEINLEDSVDREAWALLCAFCRLNPKIDEFVAFPIVRDFISETRFDPELYCAETLVQLADLCVEQSKGGKVREIH
jgi:hypothetical protein